MRKPLTLLTILAATLASYAQIAPESIPLVTEIAVPQIETCANGFFPFEIGTRFTTSHYDSKGKLSVYVDSEVQGVEMGESGPEAMVGATTYSNKDRLVIENVYDVYCFGNAAQFDLTHQLNPLTMSSLMDFNIEVNGEGFEYPTDMEVGDTIKSAEMTLRITNNDREVQKILIRISSIKVVANDAKIKTPAGNYDCYKITYNLTINRGFTETFNVEQYVSRGIGVVRTDHFDAKGKKVSYSQLTKFMGVAKP